MELEIEKQALALAEAVLVGAAVGLVYDLLRPFRYRAGRGAAIALDCLFACLAFAAAFLYGQFTYKGRLGIWELMGLALGFALYMRVFSGLFSRLISPCAALLFQLCAGLKRLIKKSHDFLNLYFQKRQ